MNRLMVLLPVVALACSSSEPTPTEVASPAAAVATTAPAQPAAAAALLTDDKLARFAVFRRETLAMTADVMSMAMGAGAKAMGDDPTKLDQRKFEGAIAKDDRLKAIEAKNQAALSKAGLTQGEIAELTQLTTEYYTKAMIAADARKQLVDIDDRIAKAQAKNKQPGIIDTAMQKPLQDQVAEFETFKQEFGAKHGAAALAAMAAREAEFIQLNQEMLGALVKKPAGAADKKAEGKVPAKKKRK